MKFNPSEPRPYIRHGVAQRGRWEIDLRGVLDNGLIVKRERRVFPPNPAGKVGKREAATMAQAEWGRWNRHGQVLRPGQEPALARTGGMRSSDTAPTFAQFAPDYLAYCASPTGGPRGANSLSTLESKESVLRKHVLPAFGSMRMDQITRQDVDRYIINKAKGGRAVASIRHDVGFLRGMLLLAESHDLIASVPKLRLPPGKGRDIEALDSDEAKRFAAVNRQIYTGHQAVLIELCLRTGLRCGEALALYPADFDLQSKTPTVHVARSWSVRGRYGPTKGRKSRTVPLVPELAERVDALLAERGISIKSKTEHPFGSPDDLRRPLDRDRVLHWVRRVGRIAKIRKVHTHMLRHTFGTECARRGVPLLTIKEWMGHADVTTTMRYLHLGAPDHLRWAELLVE